MRHLKLLACMTALWAVFLCLNASAQFVPNHAVPLGLGSGHTGFGFVGPCTSGTPIIGQGVTSDPACSLSLGAVTVPTPGSKINTAQAANTAWVNTWFAPLTSLVYRLALSNITFYVSTTGSDTSNDCTVIGSPCATMANAVLNMRHYLWNGFTPSLQLLDTGSTTNYDEALVVNGPLAGATTVQVYGNAADNTRVVLRCTTDFGDVVNANDYGGITLHSLTLSGGTHTGCNGVEARNAIVDLDNINFNAFSAGTDIFGRNAADINITCTVSCPPSLTFSGSAVAGITLTKNSHLSWGTNTVINVPNAITFSTVFIELASGSTSDGGGITVSGAGVAGTTGTQCLVLSQSDLQIIGGMPSWPGTAGTCTPRPGSQQIVAGSSSGTITAGTTSYVGLWGASTTAAQVFIPVAVAGSFRNLAVILDGAPGAANNVVVTLRNQSSASDSTLTCTITDPATTCTDSTHSVGWVAGQSYAIKAVSSGGNAVRVSWGMEFDTP